MSQILHNFKTTGIFKISSYGNFVTTFACLILARNCNSRGTVYVYVSTLPVAVEPTLRAIKHQEQRGRFCTDYSLPCLLRGLFY